jgi:PAS fold
MCRRARDVCFSLSAQRTTSAPAASCIADEWGALPTQTDRDSFLDCIHRDDLEAVRTKFFGCIEGRYDSYQLVYRVVHADGTVLTLKSCTCTYKNTDGTER